MNHEKFKNLSKGSIVARIDIEDEAAIKMSIKSIIKSYDFYYYLRTFQFVEAIWLYGSQAAGVATPGSDIDLAVVCPLATEENWAQAQSIMIKTKKPTSIDIVRFDSLPEKNILRENILKNHIVLFERKKNSFAWYESFLELNEALEQLEEMVQEPLNEKSYVRDATIQRFEFCVELFWKTLKKICHSEQFETQSPREVLQKSFLLGLISDEPVWHEMLDDRNNTSHIYRRDIAYQIYYKIDAYYKHMNRSYQKIKEKYQL